MEQSEIANWDAETNALETAEATVEDLGLEVVEDTPQLVSGRPVRHIRASE